MRLIQKYQLVIFSYPLNEKSENEIKERIVFEMVSKILRINLTKKAQSLYNITFTKVRVSYKLWPSLWKKKAIDENLPHDDLDVEFSDREVS